MTKNLKSGVAAAAFFLITCADGGAFAQAKSSVVADEEYQLVLLNLVESEGGFVNHPNDRGGPTNTGITLPALRHHLGRPVEIDELMGLSAQDISDFYRQAFWEREACRGLPRGVRAFFLDTSVMSGEWNAIRMLQRAAGMAESRVDGIFGPETHAAIAATPPDKLLAALAEERIVFVRAIAENDPSQQIFLKGWERRIHRVLAQAQAVLR